MRTFTITNDGDDYGTWVGATAADALLACRADADRTRIWTIEHLSDSAKYGQSDGRVNGNGAQDRANFWYVSDDGAIGVFRVTEAPLD